MAIKHYSIVVGIQVSNKTEYFLTKPIAKQYSGYISIPPGRIEPKHTEFMVNIPQFLLFISEYEEQLTSFFLNLSYGIDQHLKQHCTLFVSYRSFHFFYLSD